MNFPTLLIFSLLLVSTIAQNPDDFSGIVDVTNQIKNLLDGETAGYKITWDISLALYASERIDSCPIELEEGEMFVKSEEVMGLIGKLNGTDTVSLNPLPTIAIFHGKSASLHVDIGSRIGCASKNCSSGNNLFCVFDTRKYAHNRLESQKCGEDELYPNLCEELPTNYSSMDSYQFQWNMMNWNEHRRTFAKKFMTTGMNELTWSNEAVKLSKFIGRTCNPNHSGFEGTHFHMHPRSLDPLGAIWMLTHDKIDGSTVFGNSTIEMFAPQRKEIGCIPLDCEDYSYVCVLGPDWSSPKHVTIPTGKLCGECPDRCNDGLCQESKVEELVEEPGVKKENETTTGIPSGSKWRVVAVLVCFVASIAVVLLLLYTIVTHQYYY